MKYIRTKDGRFFKILSEDEKFLYLETYEDIGVRLWEKGKDDIIKQADSIEDLCDGILVEEIGNETNRFIMETDELKKMSKEEIENHLTSWRFYLFIKNDRGLIYIAKMNDEGELELK